MEEPWWQDGGALVVPWGLVGRRLVAFIDVLAGGWQLVGDVLVVGRVDSAQNK